MKYFLGIDGGGTKTALCAARVDEQTLRYTSTSGSSWREHGAEAVAAKLKAAVADLMGENYQNIAGIAMALPCYGESDDGDYNLEQAIRGEFGAIPVHLTNDVEAGWAGSLSLSPGINIVAGTGSIAFGKDSQGKTARSGGWSEFFGDEGSCYWVGRKVMEVFSKQSDGRIPRDALYTTVCNEFNLKNDFSFIDLMHAEYIPSRKQVAKIQFLAEKAARAGSKTAAALYEEAVRELLLIINAVKAQLDFRGAPWAVSYSGGLFMAGDLVLPYFTQEIEKAGGKVAAPLFGPTEGALLLAYQRFCPEDAGRIQSILTNAKTK